MSATGRNWMVAGAGVLAGTLGLASGPAGCARHGLDRGEDVPVARLVADGGWDAGTMLEVENVRGGVVVRVDPDAGAVRTRATARPTERPWYDRLGVADGDVAEAVAITSVLEQSDAGPVVRVTARQNEPEEGPTGRAAAVDLVITTPPVAGVRVTTRDGRVELAGVSGRVEVHVGGAAGGPIEMRTAGALVGPVALGTTRGDVLLQVTDEAGAQVEMEAQRGRSRFVGPDSDANVASHGLGRMSVRLGDGSARVSLRSEEGNVLLRSLPRPEAYRDRRRF